MAKDFSDARYTMLQPAERLHHYLLGWYDHAKRAMPWRETTDPYAIWLSETMLQQTQVETVKPFYYRFLQAFPTVADLARADLQEVLSLWAGLGYYRRAKHLHLAARQMVEVHGGKVPGDFDALLSLPGVGRYTAGAVGSIAFGLKVPVVDGNVMRVIARLTGFDRDIADTKNAAFFWRVAEEIVEGANVPLATQPAHRPPSSATILRDSPRKGREMPLSGARFGDVNQALMELGATVCAPVSTCLICPVREFCRAYAEGRQGELPVKRKKGAVPVVRGAALVITRNSNDEIRMTKQGKKAEGGTEARKGMEVLVMQRPMGGVWEGMWEIPVVGEGNDECRMMNAEREGGNARRETRNAKWGEVLARWVRSVLGLRVENVVACGEVVHVLTHRRMEIRVLRGELGDAECGMRKGEGGEARNMKRETRHGEDVLLPRGVEMGGGRYVAWRWVGWPLGEEVPLARVVWKVAGAAMKRECEMRKR